MFRLLRLGALLGAAHHARRLFSPQGLIYAGAVLALVVVGGGIIFTAVERSAQHLSIESGIWWAIVTVTTVGYGDIVPHTEAGRAVAVVVMVTGIGTAALLVGAASQRFVAGSSGDDSVEEGGQPSLAELHGRSRICARNWPRCARICAFRGRRHNAGVEGRGPPLDIRRQSVECVSPSPSGGVGWPNVPSVAIIFPGQGSHEARHGRRTAGRPAVRPRARGARLRSVRPARRGNPLPAARALPALPWWRGSAAASPRPWPPPATRSGSTRRSSRRGRSTSTPRCGSSRCAAT